MAHGLEGGVERERLRTMVAMASIFLDRHTKACQFCNGVRKGPLVDLKSYGTARVVKILKKMVAQ